MSRVRTVDTARRAAPVALAKRGWLYSGLAVAPGVAMARRVTDERLARVIVPASPPPVLLAGDRVATGIEPTLRRVLADHGRVLTRTSLSTLASRSAPRDRLIVLADVPLEVAVAMAPEVQRAGGRLVVVPLAGSPWNLSRAAAEQLRRSRAAVVPVARLGLAQEGRSPTAAAFAALAGAIWTYVR